MDFCKVLKEKENAVLTGQWGTIGPCSLEAGAKLAKLTGGSYGLLCHSYDAAYESVLRHFGVRQGTCVLVAAVSVPSDAILPKLLGSAPVFLEKTDPEKILKAIRSFKPAALILDAAGRESQLPALYECCQREGVPFIVNAEGVFRRETCLSKYADAVLYSLEKGSEIDAGKGGLVVTDSEPVYAGTYAYHNCGRSFGEGCSLDIDGYIGGDLRVTEWTSAVALAIMETGSYDRHETSRAVLLTDEPVFAGAALA